MRVLLCFIFGMNACMTATKLPTHLAVPFNVYVSMQFQSVRFHNAFVGPDWFSLTSNRVIMWNRKCVYSKSSSPLWLYVFSGLRHWVLRRALEPAPHSLGTRCRGQSLHFYAKTSGTAIIASLRAYTQAI